MNLTRNSLTVTNHSLLLQVTAQTLELQIFGEFAFEFINIVIEFFGQSHIQ